MQYKQKFLALTMLFIILASNSLTVLGTSASSSGEDTQSSGEVSGETVSGETSSGETESGDDSTLKSTALSSSISTNKNTSITSTLRAEIDESETDLTYVIETQPTHGTLLYEDTSINTFTYTPETDYVGTDSFSFKLTNGSLYSNTAMVTITIAESSTQPVIPFNYVDMQNHWGNYSASHLAARGLIIGEEIGNRYYFKPNTLVTRGDFMLYLLAITESNKDSEIEMPIVIFADQNLYPDWLLEASKLAYAKGIIKGSLNGNQLYLNLYNNLTRAEAAVMVNNLLKPANFTEDLEYEDKNTIPEYASQAIKNLTGYKILQGDGVYFRPLSVITKAEAGEICYKLLKQIESDGWNTSSSGDLK